ncbi:hypothetical protein [Pseudovibrio axinellae]|uniref:hypothetical protein n=1 Tax=Pseudovibrio axinellae TaxID=989403 RepID=UPI00082DEA19|nr:hypothetical protein [Pseudovibrio axinellae]
MSSSAFAATDVFLISRGLDQEFIGSHEVQKMPREGYVELRLCGTSYWVRPYSIAWTKWEERFGHNIRLELNQGYGWVVMCNKPTTQISLQDVGIYTTLDETMKQGDPDKETATRFQAIRRTFIMRNGLTPEEAEAEIARRKYESRESLLNQLLNEREDQ